MGFRTSSRSCVMWTAWAATAGLEPGRVLSPCGLQLALRSRVAECRDSLRVYVFPLKEFELTSYDARSTRR